MEIIGTQTIPAPRATVWAALNDPQVLKKCLPGCESVERTAEDEFKVVVVTSIGPLRARFNGVLRLTEVNAPVSCVMVFEGQGGAVGFGKGSSAVTLSETPEGTALAYNAQAHVGGKLAQVGSRLIESVAKKMTDDFFKAFRKQLAPDVVPEALAVGGVAAAGGALGSAASAKSSAGTAASSATASSGVSSSAASSTHTTQNNPTDQRPMVPAWWLALAALIGSATTIAGALFLR
jgi:carbon monoxide dehydrogenase subunit G